MLVPRSVIFLYMQVDSTDDMTKPRPVVLATFIRRYRRQIESIAGVTGIDLKTPLKTNECPLKSD